MTNNGPLLRTIAQAAVVFNHYQAEKQRPPGESLKAVLERSVRTEVQRAQKYVVYYQVKKTLAISTLVSFSIAGFFIGQPYLGSEWTACLIAFSHLILLSGVALAQKRL